MYCSSCGTEVTKELNYCNRCGANLNPTTSVSEQPVRIVNMNGPIWAMALMVVLSLGIILATVSDLARKDFHPAALTWIVLGSLGMILGVVALFLRHWSHMAGVSQRTEQPAKRKKSNLSEPRPAQLPPSRIEPVPSVTENTTRTFKPIERGR
jgi:disulfide bond formation protein DsbB